MLPRHCFSLPPKYQTWFLSMIWTCEYSYHTSHVVLPLPGSRYNSSNSDVTWLFSKRGLSETSSRRHKKISPTLYTEVSLALLGICTRQILMFRFARSTHMADKQSPGWSFIWKLEDNLPCFPATFFVFDRWLVACGITLGMLLLLISG